MKDFSEELVKFQEMLENNIPFAFIRFADGEGSIIDENKAWLRRRRPSASWEYKINDKEHQKFRKKLIESIEFNSDNYYIGIPCREAHQKRFHYLFEYLKKMTTVPEEQLTFSTVFKDANWKCFLKKFIPEATKRECYLVANENAKKPKEKWLNFKKMFDIPKTNAHLSVDETYENIKDYIDTNNTKGAVFLFASGVGANVVIHKLWKYNKHNSYIDIGSTLDNYTMAHSRCGGRSRVYIRRRGRGYRPWKWG